MHFTNCANFTQKKRINFMQILHKITPKFAKLRKITYANASALRKITQNYANALSKITRNYANKLMQES